MGSSRNDSFRSVFFESPIIKLPILMISLWIICGSGLAAAGEPPRNGADNELGNLLVKVGDAQGRSLTGFNITLVEANGLSIVVPSTDKGRAFLNGIEAGIYTLTATMAGFGPESIEVEIAAGKTQQVAIVFGLGEIAETVTVVGPYLDQTVFKLPVSLHETPRSLTVVDAEQIREMDLKYVNDALAYAPGMAVNSYRTGGYHFYSRGYRMRPDDTRIDGMAGINAGGRYSASLFGIEQAVLLRGPAGLLYGSSGAPGGLVNLITKKPLDQSITRVDMHAGGYQGKGIGLGERDSASLDFDSTGRLTDDGRILYRALLSAENASYFSQGVTDHNRYANASLTFKLDAEGRYSLTPMVQWTHLNRPVGGGTVFSPTTSLSSSDGISGPINTSDLSPLDVNLASGGGIDDTIQAGVAFQGSPSAAFKLNGTYRFIGYDTEIDQFTPQISSASQRQALATNHTVERIQSRSNTERRYHNLDVNGTYEVLTERGWKSTTQVGLFTRQASTRSARANGATPGPGSAIDIYTGLAETPLTDAYPDLVWGDWSDTSYWNIYVQNRTSLADDRWILTLGLGTGQDHPQGRATQKSGLLPNAALVFNSSPQLAFYGSYSASYDPNDTEFEDIQGNTGTFDPTLGDNYEIGAKYDLADGKGTWTFSLFETEVDHALVQSASSDLNPNGNRYYEASGARRSRGAEWTGEFLVTSNWRLSGSLSWLDAVYLGGGPESAAATLPVRGTRAEKSPEWSYSFWSRYNFSRGPMQGLGASLGIIWQDERFGGNRGATPSEPDPLLLPSFTRVDAGLYYQVRPDLDLQLNIENLVDELIFVSGTDGSNLEIAAPRNLRLRIGYRFN